MLYKKMLSLTLILLFTTLVQASEIKTEKASEQDFEALGLHYGKYLKEVVAALDKDQKFTETIKDMKVNDIQSGKVAEQLMHVHEDVRKKLNDLKYLEIKRLSDLATRKNEIEQYGETYHGSDKRKWRTLGNSLKELPEHLGSHNTYFDVKDLHKLMVAATSDLEKIDQERKKDYNTYELEKEWQFQERLKMLNETEKQEAIKLRQKLKDKHNDHPKVHEPGTRQQFEEVWEKKDHLPKQEFDPRTFFALHDTNSDNNWDQHEVRQLLVTEISKIYDPNNPEDDPNEMEEEYERMREHIYKEIDIDKNGLISLQEFLDYSKKPEFKMDHGWDDVNKKETFSKQDYEDYQKNREKMMREMHGHYDPAYYANQPGNLHLPNWGLGMPAGVHPSQYYGYQVDPNHPQAHQIMAQQQQMAYHQQAAAFQQQPAYQQPGVQQQGNPQYYQAHQAQPIQYQQKPPVQQQPAQLNFQQSQPIQQAAPAQQPQVQQQPQGNFQQPQAQQQQQPQAQQQQQSQVQQQQQPQAQPQQQPLAQPQQQPLAQPQQQPLAQPQQQPLAQQQQPQAQQQQWQPNVLHQ